MKLHIGTFTREICPCCREERLKLAEGENKTLIAVCQNCAYQKPWPYKLPRA